MQKSHVIRVFGAMIHGLQNKQKEVLGLACRHAQSQHKRTENRESMHTCKSTAIGWRPQMVLPVSAWYLAKPTALCASIRAMPSRSNFSIDCHRAPDTCITPLRSFKCRCAQQRRACCTVCLVIARVLKAFAPMTEVRGNHKHICRILRPRTAHSHWVRHHSCMPQRNACSGSGCGQSVPRGMVPTAFQTPPL
jgi:hypothetical protein